MSIVAPARPNAQDPPQISAANDNDPLANARALIALGVPVFPMKPNPRYDRTGGNESEFIYVKGWQNFQPTMDSLNDYQPGDLLAAVMGHTVDAVDVDTKNGASIDVERQRLIALGVPIIGAQITPSGGAHFFIPRTGIRSAAAPVNGVDFRGGDINGGGRGLIFIAPTTRPKYDGVAYNMVQVPTHADIDLTEGTLEDISDSAFSYLTACNIIPRKEGVAPTPSAGAEPVGNVPDDLRNKIDQIPPWNINRETGQIDRSARLHHLVGAIQRAGFTQGQALTLLTPWCALYYSDRLHRLPELIGYSWSKIADDVAKEAAKVKAANDWVNGLPEDPSGNAGVDHDSNEDEPSTWLPVDLAPHLDGSYVALVPTMLERADGNRLIYPGKVHSIYGESESGKSFVAQYACAVEIMAGRKVLYLDFEDSPGEVAHRLKLFGATSAQIKENFIYVQPFESLTGYESNKAFKGLLASTYSLCVLDGYTVAMSLITQPTGTPESQVAAFMRVLPKQVVRYTGAAILTIDHVVKSKDGRGRFALGSQEKLNQVTGAAYSIEVAKAIYPGARGELVLRVTKDRLGQVRRNAGKWRASDQTQEVARVVVDSTDSTWCNVIVGNPTRRDQTEDGSPWQPTHAMEAISRFLESCPEPVSTQEVKRNAKAKAETTLQAINALVDGGYVERVAGARGTNLHKIVTAYREPLDSDSAY